MAYIGFTPTTAGQSYRKIDDISGSFNGTTTSFAILVNGAAPVPFPVTNSVLISVGGVIQNPDDTGAEGFRISGTNIIFSSAPNTGEDFFGVILAGADYLNVGANFPDGTSGGPSITFDADNDTGFYRSGSGTVSFTSNAVQSAIFGNSSLTAPSFIPTTSTVPSNGVYLPATNTLGLSTDTTERVRLDSSGRFLLGTSTARANYFNSTLSAALQIEGTGHDSSSVTITRNSNDGSAPTISLAKSRGTATGSNTVVQSGDDLGYLAFQGSDGSEFVGGAYIYATVDGTPGANDLPTRLVFSVTSDGASSPTERMRINNDGSIVGGGNTLSANLYSNPGFSLRTGSGSNFEGLSLSKTSTGWGTAVYIHRSFSAGDGTLIEFAHDTVTEGTISVSGTTVSYNGGHLSRWSQTVNANENATLLKGTVMTNLDEMCEWFKEDGTLEENEQLNKMAVSSVEGDPNVAGVLVSIDDDGDLNVGMTGDMIIRIAEGVTVERGDLLISAGDGTAKPQDDDIIRSKTIAKVTSTNVSCTYDDGSYCVPCVLMAC